MVCPYEARTISFKDGWNFDAAEAPPYESYGTPHADVAEKCVFCASRVDDGALPHCVEACPMAARVFGDVEIPQATSAPTSSRTTPRTCAARRCIM